MKSLSDQLNDTSTLVPSNELDDRADLTPLIDCVFLLLLFFIVTSSFHGDAAFTVNLPSVARADATSTESGTTISINEQGLISIGNTRVTANSLAEELRSQHQRAPIQLLVINGDADCPYHLAVSIMEIARSLGIEQVVFAVKK